MAHDLVVGLRSTSEEGAHEATATTPSPRGRVRAGAQWMVDAAPIAAYLAAGYAHRWITDDGFIYLRVVRQIRTGNGPVFNAGERVEAFTGTLWVMLLAGADLLTPVRLEWLAVLLGLGCGAAGIALAMAGADWPAPTPGGSSRSGRRSWYEGDAVYQERTATAYARLDTPLRDDLDLPLGTFTGIGIVGYAMGPDFTVLDVLGLADGFTAHLENTPADERWEELSLAGHEKALPRVWIAARLTAPGSRPDPDAFLVHWVRLLDSSTGDEFQEQVAWARAALRCDEIVALRTAADGPLTLGRFAHNVRLSFENTRLRIPADPEQAYHRFCGSGTPEEVRAVRDG